MDIIVVVAERETASPRGRRTECIASFFLTIRSSRGSFSPGKIIITNRTSLAPTDRAVAIYPASGSYLEVRGVSDGSHRQLAFPRDRSFEFHRSPEAEAGIPRVTVHYGERPRYPVITLAHATRLFGVSCIQFCRRDERICAIKPGTSCRRLWSLRHRCSRKAKNSDDPQPADPLWHMPALPQVLFLLTRKRFFGLVKIANQRLIVS